jgi:trimeric autotransporter adhesin
MYAVHNNYYGRLALWTGNSWQPMGSMLWTPPIPIVADLGSGPHLYAFGTDLYLADRPFRGFAVWNGTDWERPPSNHFDIETVQGSAAVVFDDGTGPAIYLSAQISLQSDTQNIISGLGRWDGQTWTNFGGPNLGQNTVYARGPVTVFDDGRGPALYATGSFSDFGGVRANGIARYQNSQWSGVG